MIFSELYGAYYNAMAKIIDKAIAHPLEKGELSQIVSEYAFGESVDKATVDAVKNQF